MAGHCRGSRMGASHRSRRRLRVTALMESSRPEGIVCANDWTAARLMHTLFGSDTRSRAICGLSASTISTTPACSRFR